MYAVQTQGPEKPATTGGAGIRLAPLTPALRAVLERAAAADGGHGVIRPTHAVLRGETVIGYVSLGTVAMLYAWMDRTQATARESFAAWTLAEAQMKRDGHTAVCLPVEATSPFGPFVNRRGYATLGSANFNLKEL